jgi:regulation of enolase protein 1 (concanavalin A-like superfamily)
MRLEGLPMPLEWEVPAADWEVGEDGALRIVAGPRTDLFVDPGGGPPELDAPRLAGAVEGDFRLSARVRADLRATFDAGALVLYGGEATWAKLALERSPEGRATIVTVVTRGLSDDANAWAVDGDAVWLRIARMGEACALHASGDGTRWDLVRHFALEAPIVSVGFSAQSPTGEGCAATFDDVRFLAGGLDDLRDGS